MCVHFPDLPAEVVRCTTCTNGPSFGRVPKPDDWWIQPGSSATVDPGDALIEGILEKAVCPRCMTSRGPIGCVCERNRLGSSDLAIATDFLEAAIEASEFTEEEASHIASSVMKRAFRRMEMTEEEEADARAGVRAQFGMKPKWFPPRVTEPTHLPV